MGLVHALDGSLARVDAHGQGLVDACDGDPVSRLGHIDHVLKAQHGHRVGRLSLWNGVGVFLRQPPWYTWLILSEGFRVTVSLEMLHWLLEAMHR